MQNSTNFSKDQLEKMISDYKNGNLDGKIDANDFVGTHLTQKQANAINKAMENPDLLNALLATPQAKKFIDKLSNKE